MKESGLKSFMFSDIVSIRLIVLWLAVIMHSLSLLSAADDPPKPVVPPRIALCNPLVVEANAKTEIVIRGWGLVDVSGVQCDLEGATVTILKQESAPVPGRQDAKQIGKRRSALH
ncbi:MAG: hypothetical protein R3C05_06250 [Pirellulaceae bacterium]